MPGIFSKAFHHFLIDTRGNMAMLCALSVIPLVGAGGLALDYTYAETMKTKLSAAADSAALAGAQLYGSTQAQRIARAQDTFNAAISEMPRVSLVSFAASDVTTAGVYSGFKVEVAATTDTFLGKVFGMDTLPLGARAEASLGDGGKLEIALVLDTTGSMAGSKLASLKSAANSLITNLDGKKLSPDQIKYALVPFAQYVNVGLANRNKPWISVPADTSTTQNVCWNDYPVTSTSNCRTVTATSMNDGVPVSYQTQTCDYIYGPPVQVCGPSTTSSTWNGCVGSRNYPLNIQDGNYGTPVPGLPNEWCPGEVVPLTTSVSAIQTGINTMSASGETYIPAGLSWGWRALSPQDPLGESDKGKTTQKVQQYLILMTDGANTKSPRYPDHWGTDAALANQLTSELCTAIKADQITVFTIAFDVTDTTIKNILQSCATTNTNFFDAANASQLSDAFSQIGNAITALRLQK